MAILPTPEPRIVEFISTATRPNATSLTGVNSEGDKESRSNGVEHSNADLSGRVEAIHQSSVAGIMLARMGARAYIHGTPAPDTL